MAPRYYVVVTLVTGAIVGAVVGCAKDAPTGPSVRPGLPEAYADITVQAIPANDDFDNAIVIGALPFTHSVNTVDATIASDDPVGDETCGFGPIHSHTVWYEFTRPRTHGSLSPPAGATMIRTSTCTQATAGT